MKLTSRWALPVLAATASVALVTSNPAAGAQAATAQTARPAAGIMTTVAGGPGGPGPATGVGISVCAVKFAHGALYLSGNGMVRRVDPRTGQLTTPVADWSRVTANPYDIYSNSDPCGITVDSAGNLLEAAGTQIKVMAARSGHFYGRAMAAGHIYVVVNRSRVQRAYGTPSGNGRPAIAAELSQANDVELDHTGNVIVTDAGVAGGRDYPPSGAQVRVVAERTGRFYGQKMTAGDIYTVAGARYKSATRSTLATRTWLGLTIGTVRTDRSGNLVVTVDNKYISSELSSAAAVQVVAVRTGRFYGRRMIAGHMYSIAGNGTNGHSSGDGGPATKAGLDCAAGVALDHNGNVIIADCNQVRVVAEHSARFYGRRMTSGGIYAIAGLGQVGDSGDSGPAAQAAVNAEGVTVDNVGNVVVNEVGLTRLIATRTGRFYGKQMRAAKIYLIAGTHAACSGRPVMAGLLPGPRWDRLVLPRIVPVTWRLPTTFRVPSGSCRPPQERSSAGK